ncbi:MAG: 4Fe-4S dicluster domain-containing protein [Deltaproteobacteria bacterium]|nr:4Fe-4S dicluster domain-containing protein [Deltaproteobacteria bacterium]
MTTLINTDLPLCIGCNKCVRSCPVGTSNVTFLDKRNRLKVRIDKTRCISCGSCLEACHRGARHYVDDTESFFKDLADGKPLSLIMFPAVRSNLPEYKKSFAQLKKIGVHKIFNLSMGMELFVWANLRYLENYKPHTMISSNCPGLVTFLQTHRPELLPRLSPIINPTTILANIIKTHLGNNDGLAVVSACLANSVYINQPSNNLRYNISISRLRDYLIKMKVELSDDTPEVDFDPIELGLDTTLDFNGDFRTNFRQFLDSDLRLDRLHGTKYFPILDEYATAPPETLPQIFDVAGCEGGCSMGPGRVEEIKRFVTNTFNYHDQLAIQRDTPKETLLKRQKRFDEIFQLDNFLTSYSSSPMVQDYVSEDRIKDAYMSLNKHTTTQKTIDCFACGSPTCFEMARKIALGVNLPSNCVLLAQELISQSNKKISDYLTLVRLIGEYMLASGSNDIITTIEHSLMALCSSLDISRSSIWRTTYDINELPKCDLVISFPARIHFTQNTINSDLLPGWLETLSDGEIITKSYTDLTTREKLFFTGRNIGVLCMIPIIAQGDFWGIILIARRHNQTFTREEISVIESSAFLIISSLIAATYDDPKFFDNQLLTSIL